MKGLGNVLVAIGVLLILFSVVGKFVGGPTIGLGLVDIDAISGIIMANSILLIGIFLKLWEK